METENIEAKKKELIGKLLLKPEDTLKELESLIEISQKLFMIESETGTIVLSKDRAFSSKEKILLLLIGRYFAKEIGVLQNDQLTVSLIEKEISIARTSLSGPLKELITKGVLKKNDNSEYHITHHQIKTILKEITNT